jgi:hypothetical protein
VKAVPTETRDYRPFKQNRQLKKYRQLKRHSQPKDKEKNRGIVFREIINTMETKPISSKEVFYSGVFYTRDNTYKDCYIRQECSQHGAFRTRIKISN